MGKLKSEFDKNKIRQRWIEYIKTCCKTRISGIIHSLVENNRYCFPSCEFFRCGQQALIRAGRRIYCRWADDNCIGRTCNYTICIRGRLLSNGICGMSVSKKTDKKTAGPEVIDTYNIKIREKLHRRFGEEDLI